MDTFLWLLRMLTLMMTMMSILDLPIQGNLLRGIVNWSGVAQTVVQGPKQSRWKQFQLQSFLISTWSKKQYLQTMLAIGSENIFWKTNLMKKTLQFWTVLLCYELFPYLLKVRQSENEVFKLIFLPKNDGTNLLQWYLRSTCFRSFFGRNWRHQKYISKLTDI